MSRGARPKSGLRWSNWASSSGSQTDVLPNEPITINIKSSLGGTSKPTTAILVGKSDHTETTRPPTATKTTRPGSAVRPLSGNIFMRRSVKRGWVAKAYPEQHSSTSQPNLELERYPRSRLDCESLDSFFDDDFEDQDDQLGLLLNCNTMGVESKAMKQDWVSGEVDIPKFHCPRCRDHWYGIRTEPCDEELARLIREGLWKTGNTGKEGGQRGKHRGGSFNLTKTDRDPLTTTSSKSKLPELKHGQFKLKKNSSSSSNWNMKNPDDVEKQKKKKRITFLLNEDESRSGSQFELSGREREGGGGGGMGRGGKGAGGLGEESGDNEGSHGGAGANYGRGGGQGGGMGGASGGQGSEGGVGGDSEDAKQRKKKSSHGGGDNELTNGIGSQSLLDGRDGGLSSRRGKGSNLSGLDGSDSNSSQRKGGGSDSGGMGQDGKGSGFNSSRLGGTGGANDGVTGGSGYDKGQGGGYGDGSDGNKGRGVSGGNDGGEGGDKREGGQSGSTGQDSNKTSGGGRRGALRNKQGGNKGAGTTANNFTNPVDHGKKVRKSGGYMRAVSPTSSEWGDPLHARSFISSTATSRRGSTSNLLGDEEEGEGGTGRNNNRNNMGGRKFLPPIVHPISHPPPSLGLDLMGGPSLTRAWTFSYH